MNNLQEKYIKHLILSASRGDRKAAIEIIKQYVDTVFAGKIPNKYVLDYVAFGLNDILDGEDPQKALKIKRPAVRSSVDEDAQMEIAVLIEMVLRRNKANKVKAPVQKAIETVAEDTGKSYETVRGIRDKHRKIAKLIADKKLRK